MDEKVKNHQSSLDFMSLGKTSTTLHGPNIFFKMSNERSIYMVEKLILSLIERYKAPVDPTVDLQAKNLQRWKGKFRHFPL